MQRLLPVILVAILAGCLDPLAPDSGSLAGAGALPRYVAKCCLATLGSEEEFVGEPNLAAHPSRTGVFALGANSAVVRAGSIPPSAGLTSLFVTEDGGTTWASRSLPVAPGWLHFGDPALVFDSAGVLHFSELVGRPQTAGALFERAALYARSEDLGATWAGIAVLEDGGTVDRNWISVEDGVVFLTWQHPDRTTAIAWNDGGDWERLEERLACNLQTPVVRGIVACTGEEDERFTVRIHRLDRAARAAPELTRLAAAGGTNRLLALPDSLVVVIPAGPDAFLSRSMDRGDTWSPLVGLRAAPSVEDAWTWMWPTWVEVDARGALHVLVAGGAGENCYRGTCAEAEREHEVAYFVVDPWSLALLGETLLTAADPAARGREPTRLQQPLGDDFHAIAFGSDGAGLFAYGHDRAVDVGTIRSQ